MMCAKKSNRRNTKQLDALITFQKCLPESIRVTEALTIGGSSQQEMPKSLDAVTEMEKKYIFFGGEAEVARGLLQRGSTCTFNVYLREQ